MTAQTTHIAPPLAAEVAVALVYNGSTQAVMMATPENLIDFGRGFSLSEGIVDNIDQIDSLDIVTHDQGIELQMWLAPARAETLDARRRTMTGPVGCGLCGIDSLAQAVRALPVVTAQTTFSTTDITKATRALQAHQPLHDQTRAVHAAAFYVAGQGIVAAREDVGRHNALDKLIGALASQNISAASGAIVLTSRISVDMVQKCAMAGCPILIAVSAPTAQAVQTATAAGITLIARARGTTYDLYSHPDRIQGTADVDR